MILLDSLCLLAANRSQTIYIPGIASLLCRTNVPESVINRESREGNVHLVSCGTSSPQWQGTLQHIPHLKGINLESGSSRDQGWLHPSSAGSSHWFMVVLAPVAAPQGTGTREEQLEGLH